MESNIDGKNCEQAKTHGRGGGKPQIEHMIEKPKHYRCTKVIEANHTILCGQTYICTTHFRF